MWLVWIFGHSDRKFEYQLLLYGRSFILMKLKHTMLSENCQMINVIDLTLHHCNIEEGELNWLSGDNLHM